MTATYLACLTPPGSAAIATLALRGPAAWTLVRALAQRDLPAEPEAGRFWLTRLADAERGDGDEVVVAVKQVRPEIWLEIHCHGGREVLGLLEEMLRAHGAEACSWPALTARAAGPLHAAAVQTLTTALTVRTAAIALDQFHGAFAHAATAIDSALREGDLASANRQLAALERYAAVGRHLSQPWRVVIAGPANVGKSSLVNALAGYQRSLVAPTPGTTRDVVTTLLAVDGWPIEVHDTAGQRATAVAVEQEGMARARQAMASADLCLWVMDASAPPVWPNANLGPVRPVVNKVDLPAVWSSDDPGVPRLSALTGAGVGDLCQTLATWLVPEIPPPGAAVPFTPELADAVTAARHLAQEGKAEEAQEKLAKVCRECG